MNTFDTVAALAPLPRYDARFARAVGKYILNATNASRYFYANGLPSENQTCHDQCGSTRNVIAYEGLRKTGFRPEDQSKTPCACGDPLPGRWGIPMPSDFTLYGSSHVGFLAAVTGRTSDARILQIDCLATDFRHDKAYPTYLFFNPYLEAKRVVFDVGPASADLYCTVASHFVARNVHGKTILVIPPDSAVVIVVTPAGGAQTQANGRLAVNGIVIDHHVGNNTQGKTP